VFFFLLFWQVWIFCSWKMVFLFSCHKSHFHISINSLVICQMETRTLSRTLESSFFFRLFFVNFFFNNEIYYIARLCSTILDCFSFMFSYFFLSSSSIPRFFVRILLGNYYLNLKFLTQYTCLLYGCVNLKVLCVNLKRRRLLCQHPEDYVGQTVVEYFTDGLQ